MTGGTGALGRALIRALVARGAVVGSTVHRGPTDGLPALFHPVDLADARAVGPAVVALAEALGGADVFIHAAGVTAGWDALFAVNVRAAHLAVEALRPHLRRDAALGRPAANVALLGSIGAIKAMASPPELTASHGALAGLARALGKELGPDGIRVNLLALGPLTDGASRAIDDALKAEYVKHACAKRQATPDEAAAAIAAFALANTYVTAQVLPLDGGL